MAGEDKNSSRHFFCPLSNLPEKIILGEIRFSGRDGFCCGVVESKEYTCRNCNSGDKKITVDGAKSCYFLNCSFVSCNLLC